MPLWQQASVGILPNCTQQPCRAVDGKLPCPAPTNAHSPPSPSRPRRPPRRRCPQSPPRCRLQGRWNQAQLRLGCRRSKDSAYNAPRTRRGCYTCPCTPRPSHTRSAAAAAAAHPLVPRRRPGRGRRRPSRRLQVWRIRYVGKGSRMSVCTGAVAAEAAALRHIHSRQAEACSDGWPAHQHPRASSSSMAAAIPAQHYANTRGHCSMARRETCNMKNDRSPTSPRLSSSMAAAAAAAAPPAAPLARSESAGRCDTSSRFQGVELCMLLPCNRTAQFLGTGSCADQWHADCPATRLGWSTATHPWWPGSRRSPWTRSAAASCPPA